MTYDISDDELEAVIMAALPDLISLAQRMTRSEVTIYRFQNDEFDGKQWFGSPRHPGFLDPTWLKDPAKRIYEKCQLFVGCGAFTHLSLRYWRDHAESETGFYLVGHLPHPLGTR